MNSFRTHTVNLGPLGLYGSRKPWNEAEDGFARR